MEKSLHANVRMGQRAISEDDVELILDMGKPIHERDGRLSYFISKQDVAEEIEALKGRIRRMEKAGNKKVVVSPSGSIVTVIHVGSKSPRNKRQQRRRSYRPVSQ